MSGTESSQNSIVKVMPAIVKEILMTVVVTHECWDAIDNEG